MNAIMNFETENGATHFECVTIPETLPEWTEESRDEWLWFKAEEIVQFARTVNPDAFEVYTVTLDVGLTELAYYDNQQ